MVTLVPLNSHRGNALSSLDPVTREQKRETRRGARRSRLWKQSLKGAGTRHRRQGPREQTPLRSAEEESGRN